MTISFMYDNHTFARVPSLTDTPRWKVKARIMELFEEDRSGSVFARDVWGHTVAHYIPDFDVSTRRIKVDEAKVDAFLDRCEEQVNWDARG